MAESETGEKAMENLALMDASYADFVKTFLPLYSGPQVKIRLGPEKLNEYSLSKPILCKQSRYFSVLFEGGFKEGVEQSVDLMEVGDEVGEFITVRSLELLIQWLHIGRVVVGKISPRGEIDAIVEFVRLADMCGVTGMENTMAERIKTLILANPPPIDFETSYFKNRDPNTNTFCITSQAVRSASLLPNDNHPVRAIFAMAAVEGYLRSDKHKFLKETRDVPNFAFDVLKAVKLTLLTLRLPPHGEGGVDFTEPISGMTLKIEINPRA